MRVPLGITFVLLFAGLGYPAAHAQTCLIDLPWGLPRGDLEGQFHLQSVERDPTSTRFFAQADTLGGARLEECQFEFSGGRLSGIAVLTNGAKNTHAVLRFLKRRLGPGMKEDEKTYAWFSGGTHYKYDEDSAGDGYIYWYQMKESGKASDNARALHRSGNR
jgi:hypothetical protein